MAYVAVNDAGQTGQTLATQFWNPSELVLKAGDYIQLGEDARTNLALYSEQLQNAAWATSTSGSATTPVVTANHGVSPVGTTTGDRLQLVIAANSDANSSEVFQSIAVVSGRTYTFSIWLRSLTGVNQTIALQCFAGHNYFTITPAWRRITLTEVANAATAFPSIKARGMTSLSVDALAWGAQFEEGAAASSYILTTSASGTRAATTKRLHKVLQDVTSNSSGEATLDIWPRLRYSPADLAMVTTVNAQGTFRLASNERGWSVGPDKVYDIGFSAVEAI